MPSPLPARTASAAMSADRGPDRIFVLGYVRAVEIGAYAEEVGVPQRLSFDVTVEVEHADVSETDALGDVISYDTLVAAIDRLAEGPRISLLETFAERLAIEVLADRRAIAATVRIEKLDRLPEGGRLGVEIRRRRG